MENKTFGQPSANDEENIRLENEILKLKMLAQFGGDVKIIQPLTPQIENMFLQHIMALETAEKIGSVKLFDILGRPVFKRATDLTDEELSDELIYLIKLMADKKIVLNFLGEYDHRTTYSFITEEFFDHETSLNDGLATGMVRHFIYEDFHPNHKYDIENCCRQFVSDFFEKKFNEYSWELATEFVLTNGEIFGRNKVFAKFKTVFEAYKSFTKQKFAISNIKFEVDEKTDTGLGHAEGYVKYDAVLESGELLQIEGGFKLYMSYEAGWWKIFNFNFPGFQWE